MEVFLNSLTPQDYLKFGELGVLFGVILFQMVFTMRVMKQYERLLTSKDEEKEKLISVIVECTIVLRLVQDALNRIRRGNGVS